jgi:DNA-binding NarL/FixJ family response regulator
MWAALLVLAVVTLVALAASGAANGRTTAAAAHRVLIIGDHHILRQGVRLLFSQQPDMTVCGETDTAAETMRQIERLRPDLLIVDLSMTGENGLALIKQVLARHPAMLVLALSMREEAFYAESVLRAGAKGYLTRDDTAEHLIEAARRLLAGQIYINDRLATRMIRTFVGGGAEPGAPLVQKLTDRELEIFELIGQGMSTRVIARRLHVSVKTIGSHREHIKDKLRLDSATDLLKHAIQWVQMPTSDRAGGMTMSPQPAAMLANSQPPR